MKQATRYILAAILCCTQSKATSQAKVRLATNFVANAAAQAGKVALSKIKARPYGFSALAASSILVGAIIYAEHQKHNRLLRKAEIAEKAQRSFGVARPTLEKNLNKNTARIIGEYMQPTAQEIAAAAELNKKRAAAKAAHAYTFGAFLREVHGTQNKAFTRTIGAVALDCACDFSGKILMRSSSYKNCNFPLKMLALLALNVYDEGPSRGILNGCMQSIGSSIYYDKKLNFTTPHNAIKEMHMAHTFKRACLTSGLGWAIKMLGDWYEAPYNETVPQRDGAKIILVTGFVPLLISAVVDEYNFYVAGIPMVYLTTFAIKGWLDKRNSLAKAAEEAQEAEEDDIP